MRSHYALATAMLFLACAPKSAETADGSSAGSGSSVSGSDGSDASSDTTPTTGATSGPSPTTASQTASSSADESASSPGTISTGSATATDSGDDTGAAGLPGACAAVCAHWDACSPGAVGPVDECTANCLDGFEVPSECAMATATQWDCVAALSCEEALKFINIGEGPPSSCIEETNLADSICQDIGCNGEIGGGEETCELEQECGDGKRNYACDSEANLCTCTQDGVEGNQCPADGFCSKDHDEQIAAIEACCGWDWQF